MRFVYILSEDKISIEVQKNREKLSPFIRIKKDIDDLSHKLVRKDDKIIWQFIQLLNQSYPPYAIYKEYFSVELVKLLKQSNFIFSKTSNKSSLKKLNNYSSLEKQITQNSKYIIVPKKLKILIHSILKSKVSVSFYFEFDEIEKDISVNYDFLVPLLGTKSLAIIEKIQKDLLLNLFYDICHEHISDISYLTFDELVKLNEHELIHIQYISNSKQNKSVEFISNTLFKMNIFHQENLEEKELDFYYSVLQNYLQNKKYIDYDDKIILFDEKDIIEKLDNKTLLKVFSYNLNQDIRVFIDKILSIMPSIVQTSISKKLQTLGFKATLKGYQEEGVLWLYNLHHNKIDGGLLADEMGLGKTIQVIAFLLLSRKKHHLIIAPASLVHNWKNEILKFTTLTEKDISLSIDNSNFITILSYEYARSNIEGLKNIAFDIVVMDESQKIKNHKTQIFNAVIQLQREFTIIMTGTPIENSLNDLWNMLFTINPSLHELYTQKIQPLLSNLDEYNEAIELTINMLYPIMLQRKKKQVLDLPDRTTETILIDFSNIEKEKYTQLVKTFTSALKSGLSGRIQSIALEGLLRLRQYCSIHNIVPSSLLATTDISDSKVDKVIEIVKHSIKSQEKIIIFSQFTSSLDQLETCFKGYEYLRLDGSTSKIHRNTYVKQFQDPMSQYKIFLISLKAGGVGLNLTTAKTAILLEPWWNPAVEEQAFARIDRIGQLKKTKIYRLIYKDSIEEKINTLIEHKQDIFDSMSSVLINKKYLEMEIARDIFKIL
jgi:SNF2 family DNA or RNA helicase